MANLKVTERRESAVDPAIEGSASPHFPTHDIERGRDGVARYRGLRDSIVAELDAAVAGARTETALIDQDDRAITYGHLWDRATAAAAGLHAAGVRRGDRVALRLPDGIDWVVLFLGVLACGAVAVPINPRLTDPEVAHIVTDSGAVRVLTDVIDSDGHLALEDIRPDEPAAIFYTSGTTGTPKGTVLTHENLLSNVESSHRVTGMTRDDGVRTIATAPFCHVMACNSQLLSVLAVGGLLVCRSPLDRPAMLSAVPRHGITHLATAPAIYHYLLADGTWRDHGRESVRWVGYGAAPASPTLIGRIRDAFPQAELCNGYGLTEATAGVSSLPGEFATSHAGSVGMALPVVDLALDKVDQGAGELLVRGPNIAAGYWNLPDATAATFQDGWLRTGDIARIDDGKLYLLDRLKDVINRGGENVYCVEVENALAAVPGVLDAAVVGVPDEMMGEKVGAVLVLDPAVPVDAGKVRSLLGDRLADFKIPEYMRRHPGPLPRSAAGKVLKATLKADAGWESFR
ncbi:class I adenylate-forming enzyme family protein [Actinokineospora sp.]|uniref:class I adenylate-forming enzyme family protein n=1 Tax=Actinokineospora sp. TaxID=1872133 RepID=UPI0040380D98